MFVGQAADAGDREYAIIGPAPIFGHDLLQMRPFGMRDPVVGQLRAIVGVELAPALAGQIAKRRGHGDAERSAVGFGQPGQARGAHGGAGELGRPAIADRVLAPAVELAYQGFKPKPGALREAHVAGVQWVERRQDIAGEAHRRQAVVSGSHGRGGEVRHAGQHGAGELRRHLQVAHALAEPREARIYNVVG